MRPLLMEVGSLLIGCNLEKMGKNYKIGARKAPFDALHTYLSIPPAYIA